jgi:hypothetical protein
MNRTEIVGVWNGNNIGEIIKELMRINQELSIRVSKGKLLIKEINVNFYICVKVGHKIEIPESLIAYDQVEEEPLPVPEEILKEETKIDSKKQIQKEMANQNKISWGLV